MHRCLVVLLGLPVAAAQAPNPCTTAAPAPPPPPPVTCSGFTCPAKMALKADAECPGGMCSADVCCFVNPCTTATTTLPTTVTTTPETTVTTTPATTVTTTLPTTVTTTPAITCDDFKCPPKFALKSPSPVCAAGQCDAEQCCFENPCTTGTTTIPTTVTTTPATTVTTTPATTVTTTPAVTCADFKCPPKFALKSPVPVCTNNLCSADMCCFENPCTTGTTTIPTTVTTTPATTVTTTLPTTVTTTPATTVTTTPKPNPCTTMAPTPAPLPVPTPAPPPNPCAPQVQPRLYNAKEADVAVGKLEEKKENGAVVGWALPVLGAVAMFSFAAVVGLRIRRGRQSTRAVTLLDSVSQMSDEDMEGGLE